LLLLAVVVISVAGYLLLSPTSKGGRQLLSTAEARKRYVRAVQQRRVLEAESARFGPQLARMVYVEDPEKVVPPVIKELQKLAGTAGIHIREVKPLRSKRFASLTKVPLTVRFTCEFAQVIPFLYTVEDPNGRLVVEKFTIAASDPKSHTVDVEIQVALFTRGAGAPGEA
jgi:Tfp pilus assembly protein PilO